MQFTGIKMKVGNKHIKYKVREKCFNLGQDVVVVGEKTTYGC
jgi:hypothetical protein